MSAASVVAVIVTYQPDAAVVQEIRSLVSQVSSVLVIDNGSTDDRLQVVKKLGSIELIALGQNRGVGAAHNIGIARARALQATHVLLMDQDSLPEPDMLSAMLRAEADLNRRGDKVGALGPVFHDPRLGKSWPFYRLSRLGMTGLECNGEDAVPCDFLISSGTLIPMSVLDTVGSMNEGYFLEHIDTEWSLRARFHGYQLFGVCKARMKHMLGDDTARVPFTGRYVQIYKPYRHYYLFRNSILLWRERYAALPWKLNELRRLLARVVYFSLFVPPRLQRARFMALGIWHGLRRRAGALPP
jgi:rhamnosyltransferase